MDKQIKKVSIVMCTYNGERYLRQQLDTLLTQTYPLHEIIVQDDGSSDNTWRILSEYAASHPFIHIFHNEGEHGYNGNFFSAMQRATGDYIAICDQDDLCALFLQIHADTTDYQDAVNILRYEASKGLLAFLKLEALMVKHRRHLFYAYENGGVGNLAHALLLPIMMVYYYGQK